MKKGAKLTEQKADSAYLTNKQDHLDNRKVQSDQKRYSLVERLKAGDRTAAAELVDEYYQQIYLFMRRLGHDRQISEDLTQESFFNAWHHIGQLRDGKAFDSWLYRIAGNAIQPAIECFAVEQCRCAAADKTETDDHFALYAAVDDCQGRRGGRRKGRDLQEQAEQSFESFEKERYLKGP